MTTKVSDHQYDLEVKSHGQNIPKICVRLQSPLSNLGEGGGGGGGGGGDGIHILHNDCLWCVEENGDFSSPM